MMRLAAYAALLGLAQAARLRAGVTPAVNSTGDGSPFSALLATFRAKGEEMGSMEDPHWFRLNKRMVQFKDAVHHLVQQESKKKATKSMTQTEQKVQKRKEDSEDGGPTGHVFEHIADDKTCESGAMGSKKGVKAAEDCKALCAEQAGCVAFAFSYKPFKQCEFFSECTEADANKIRKYSLWAVKNADGDMEDKETCGSLAEYPHSKPKHSADMVQGASSDPKAFVAGDVVRYVCERDHTTNAAKDGPTEFDVTCADQGYFQPEKRGCVGASECGPLPCIRKAHPTGKVEGDSKNPKVEMVCDEGYSLDGEKVVEGGALKNALLYLECDSVGKWSPALNYLGKRGKACEPFAFIPASGMIKMYNKVFEVLFIASCNTELSKWAEEEEKMPTKLEDGTVCGENVSDDKEGDCKALVEDLKTLFADAKGQAQGFDAKPFCKDMWDLLKMDEPAAQTEC